MLELELGGCSKYRNYGEPNRASHQVKNVKNYCFYLMMPPEHQFFTDYLPNLESTVTTEKSKESCINHASMWLAGRLIDHEPRDWLLVAGQPIAL